MEIEGKTVIVTGAGTGIGRALAVEFAGKGANVVCSGRRLAKIQETADIIVDAGGKALAVRADVTSPADVKFLVSETLSEFSTVDVLFNNAGSFRAIGGLWEIDPEQWWQDVTVNLRGVMLCCRQVLDVMIGKNSGIIINMNGGGATFPLAGGSAYGASKAAVMRFTETLAKELEMEGYNIFVLGMSPGLVKTEMTQLQVESSAALKWIPSTEEYFRNNKAKKPEDCARASVELLKIACSDINGRNFSVDTDFSALENRLSEIREKDLHVLRMKA